MNNTYYHEEKKSGFSGSISSKGVSVGYRKSQSIYAEKGKTNAKSTLHLGDGTVLNKGAEITATDFTHGQITVNNGDVKFGARIDTRDVKITNKSSHFGVSVGVNSPVLDRVKQLGNATRQIQNGDVLGGGVEVANAVTGTIKGFADNQGKQNAETKEAFANNNFYANIGVNAGFTKAKSEINSHTESAAATNIIGIDENSSITYNNLKNVEYVGTKAENTSFVYNNVENVSKKAVELQNNFSSNSLSKGINAGVTIGYSNKVQTIGNGINVSANKSNQNTNETIYQNESFVNVNEIYNNTKNMTLDGFNQKGGKVVGNIENLVIKSKQNISETDGYSLGGSVGIPIGSGAVSVNVNTSQTVGNRAFVGNQSSFVVGENSNLKIKNVTNEAGIIGTNGQNSNIKIENYVGKNIENIEKLTTTGVSGGTGGVDVNYSNFEKEGITRNTVIGNVEIGKSSEDSINSDLNKANEITKDNQNSTNVNIESQTLEYAINSSKFKEDIKKAKEEIADIFTASKESIHDRGDDNRNFFGQLGEVRLSKTINNIAGERLEKTDKSEEIARTFEDTYVDLGYENTKVIFTTPENAPQLKDEEGNPKAGTAYVDKETGKRTILINVNDEKNYTKAGLIGTIAEEGSHVINALENRKVETGTDEKGLESTGRATNEYFKNLYSKNDKKITLKSDGKDYSNVDFGKNVGDDALVLEGEVGMTVQASKLYLNGKIIVVRNPYKQKGLVGEYAKYNGKYVIWIYVDGEIGAKFDPALFNAGASLSVTYFPGTMSKSDTEIAKKIVSSSGVDFILSTFTGSNLSLFKIEDNIKGNDRFSGYGITRDFGFAGKSEISLTSFLGGITEKIKGGNIAQIFYIDEVTRQIENFIKNSGGNLSTSIGKKIAIPIIINEKIATFLNPTDDWINRPKNKDYRK